MGGCSRRRLLRAGLGATVAGATAGCLGLRAEGQGDDTGTFLDWLPAPAVAGASQHRVGALSLADLEANNERLHPATVRALPRLRTWWPFRRLGALLGDVDRLVAAGPAGVQVGAATPGLEEALRDRHYLPREGYEGFDVYRARAAIVGIRGFPELVAVGDDVVVHSLERGRGELLPRETVEAVVDAKHGDVERFHEAGEGHERAATALADPTLWTAGAPDFGGPLPALEAYSHGWRVEGSVTRYREVLVFEDEADARVADVESHAGRLAPAHRSVSVERSGETATIEADVPTGRFDGPLPGDPGEDGVPDAAVAVERSGDEAVTVRHDGGQPVEATALEIRLDGEPADSQFGDAADVVRSGDTVTLDVGSALTLSVWWVAPEGAFTLQLVEEPVGLQSW